MKLSTLAFNAAGAVSARPWLLAAAAAILAALLLVSGYVGVRFERAAWLEREARSVQRAREDERAGAAVMLDMERRAGERERARRVESETLLQELRDELAKRPARCPVSRAAVRLLDGVDVPRDPGARALARPPGAKVEADGGKSVECGAVIEHCAWNKVNTCDAAADQADGLREAYNEIRRRYNRR